MAGSTINALVPILGSVTPHVAPPSLLLNTPPLARVEGGGCRGINGERGDAGPLRAIAGPDIDASLRPASEEGGADKSRNNRLHILTPAYEAPRLGATALVSRVGSHRESR